MKVLLFTSLAIFILNLSCGGSTISGLTGSGKSKDISTGNGSLEGEEGEETAPGTRKIRNNGQQFLLKTSKQLKSAVQICFGGDRMTVRSEIILQLGAEPDPNGAGIAFLSPGDYRNGDNIVDKSQTFFDGREADKRTGVSNTLVTVSYLTALQNTGNVVAYNCSEAARNQGSNPEMCVCENKDTAFEMLKRCLPGYIPDDLEDLASDLAKVCKDDQRGAISSLISSFAFAEAN